MVESFSQAQQDFMTQVYQKASEFSALTFTLTDNASQLNTVAAYRNSTAATAYAQYPSGALLVQMWRLALIFGLTQRVLG